VNEHTFSPLHAIAPEFCAMQAVGKLCDRISARLYLALHPAGSLPGGYAVPVGGRCVALRVYHACSAPGRLCIPSPGTSPGKSNGENGYIICSINSCKVRVFAVFKHNKPILFNRLSPSI
jgi:hypothetical protein